MKFGYSTNGENYYGCYDRIEDAVAESFCCDELTPGDVIFVGELKTPSIESYFSIKQILEIIADDVYETFEDGGGETIDGKNWPDMLNEAQEKELKSMIVKYLDENAPAPFTLPVNVQEIIVTEEMIRKYA